MASPQPQPQPQDVDQELEDIGEIEVAEYVVFLLALDTYTRYVEEHAGEDVEDALIKKGVILIRMADRRHLATIHAFLGENLKSPSQKKGLDKAFKFLPTSQGLSRRSLQMRRVLSRGGAATMRAVFKSNQALKEIKAAMAAALIEDADAALDKFSIIPMRNPRLRKWIDDAAESAGSGTFQNAVVAGSSEAASDVQKLFEEKVQQQSAPPASEEASDSTDQHEATLLNVQTKATEAASRAMKVSGEPDEPPSKSEVVGIAAAAVAAAMSDPQLPANIPAPLKSLDEEQLAAALTDGKVLVAAGAGAGKCVLGDTLVRTERGLIEIRDLARDLTQDTEKPLEVLVLGVHGPERTSLILDNGIRETIRVTTRHGYTLEGTPNHPILVMRDGNVQWVLLSEIDLNDHVCIDRRSGLFPETPFTARHRPFTQVTNSRPTMVPEVLNEQVASLLGWIVSEGRVEYSSHSVVDLTTTDQNQLDLYKKATHGLVDYTVSWDTANHSHRLRFGCKSNLEALADFGLTFTKAPKKEVPVGILQSPKSVVKAFLRSLFDGDGGYHRHEVYFDSSSEKLAYQVQVLLLSFGVVSRRRFKPNDHEGCWNISLTGKDATSFLKEIGFGLASKQTAAERYFLSIGENPNLDVVPGQSERLRAVMSAARAGQKISEHPKYHAFKCYRAGTRNPSYKLLGEFLEAFPAAIESHQELKELYEKRWLLDGIDDITNGEGHVYDFVVPGTHSFSAGGLINHNSTTLVSRIDYLVKDRKANPSRILACSFNKKAADELKSKIAKKLGGQDSVNVGTMHSLFYRFIVGDKHTPGFGNPEEQAMLKPPRLIAPPKKGAKTVSPTSLSTTIRNLWQSCDSEAMAARWGFPLEWVKEPPKAKKAQLLLNKWRGNDVGLEAAKKTVTSKAEAQAVIWYELYLGLKGDLPGWRPPCASASYDRFMNKSRPGGERLGDLDDMLQVFKQILVRDPKARQRVQGMFDHFLVDECVHEDTRVTTPRGSISVKALEVDDSVLSYENGGASFKRVLAKRVSGKNKGITIRTASGRELSMTKEHRIYASPFSDDLISDGELALYIMHRKDKGFRIGVSTDPTNGRPRSERADQLWILEVGPASDILFKEQQLSLKYGIPTYVFEASIRGCDQNRVDQIFAEFGSNGAHLLEARGLSVHYPHWVSASYSGSAGHRIVMHLLAHRARSSFAVSWTGDRDLVPNVPVYEVANGRWMASFSSPTYRKVREKAVEVSNQTGAILWESVRHGEQTLHLTQANSLHKGMKVLVHTSGARLDSDKLLRGKEIRAIGLALGFDIPARGSVSFSTYQKIREAQITQGLDPLPAPDTSEFELDEIVEISESTGTFVDLEVEDTSNFFGNGVLSHNCQDLNLVQHQIFDMLTEHIGDGSDGKSLWMIGDDKQCCHVDTLVSIPSGVKRLGDLVVGDTVLAYRNGDLVSQVVRHSALSTWKHGYRVTTESGKTLTMSPNHKIWASDQPELDGDQHLIYMMFRRDKGYRLGVTNSNQYANHGFSYGQRPQAEKAERLWVLEIAPTREEAHVSEAMYSLQYQVPTQLFHANWKCREGMNEAKLDALFSTFGNNGSRVLEKFGLSFDYPNWMCRNSATNAARTIQFIAHGPKGSQVTLEWGDSESDLGCLKDEAKALSGGRWLLRKWFLNYRAGLEYAEGVARRTGLNLSQRLSFEGCELRKITAAALFPGMAVAVLDKGCTTLEKIVQREQVEGAFIDIDVDDASNFFGGGILSSNSIYQFRGARPELFTSLDGKPGWKTRMIKTNYRCEAEIVEAANKLVAHNDGNIPMEARANPKKERGKASIVVETPEDNTEAAINTIGGVVKDMAMEGAKAEEYAVLARTNAELNDFETACIINEIPYVRRGGKGFLEAPESKAVLGYIDLVSGSSYEKMRESLIAVLMKPDRNLFLGPDDVAKAVDEALDDVARRNRVDVKSVNPAMLLERQNVRNLADRLKQPWKIKITSSARGDSRKGEWMYNQRVDELSKNLSELSGNLRDLSDFINSGEHDTNALLNHILDMPSNMDSWSREKGKHVDTKTLREQITHDTAIFSDDDDESDDEEEGVAAEVGEDGQLVNPEKQVNVEDPGKGLGAVKFLYELSKPNANDMTNNTDPTTAKGFVDKIARYSKLAETLRIDPDKWEREQSKLGSHAKPPAITLSTVHGVKGLEWKNVSVLMPKGKFPPERKPREDEPPPDPIEEAEKLKAERNLAYVALTRAAVNLTVVCPEKSDGKPAGMSRFVFEAGLSPGENVPKDVQPVEKQAAASEPVDPYIQDLVDQYAGSFTSAYDRRQP